MPENNPSPVPDPTADQDTTGVEQVPVLVVGAGFAGLSTALFLGLHGVPALVVERHPGTATQPKARGQAPQTMEALRVAGIADRVAAARPEHSGLTIRIAESVAGRVLKEFFVNAQPDWSALSPAGYGMASQERTEPILLDRAEQLGARVRFNTRLESFEQDGTGVTAVLRDLRTDAARTVRARYLVAADGHRSPVRDMLGLGVHGRGELSRACNIMFRADLSALLRDQGLVLYHLHDPARPDAASGLVSTDDLDRFVAFVPPQEGELSEQRCLELIRTVVGVPDLAATVLDVGGVTVSMRIADRFVAGRVLLVGDAAHTIPPTGGQGGNTAIMDGYHLAWKLAMVLHGQAGPSLLDSHDPERRPYADLLAEQQYANMVERMKPGSRDDTVAEQMDPAVLLFGYRILDGAVVREPDDDNARFEDPAKPTGRPGSRAPHVPLRYLDRELSTIDLYGRGFVLLTGSDAWTQAATTVRRRLGIGLSPHQIDGPGGPTDPEHRWRDRYGIDPDGAVLVRPDGIIAWRSTGAGTAADLEDALRTVLSR